MSRTRITGCRVVASVVFTTALCSVAARGQVTFSVDWHSPMVGLPESTSSTAITEADVLTPAAGIPILGPLKQPGIVLTGGAGGLNLALHAVCVGHAGGTPCQIEVDALSYGVDFLDQGTPAGSWWWSLDEYAIGIGGAVAPPNLSTEGIAGSHEACADAFTDLAGVPPGPLPPLGIAPASGGALDGNGFRGITGFAYPGLGLIEANLATLPPNIGDTLDAFDIDGPIMPLGEVYFSLDAAFVDPLLGIPNSGSAVAHGFVGGDVLVSGPAVPLGGPLVYATANQLGLDLVPQAGPDSDDLDALMVLENGLAGFQVPVEAYGWLTGQVDMVVFSVRRGSKVIGQLDSLLGVPIEEGDILIPPIPAGLSIYPGMLIAAENLGMVAARTSTVNHADDLNALDVTAFPVLDCNLNGVEDVVDIFTGFDPDCNRNGVPDSCDLASGRSCDLNGNLVPDECDFSAIATYCAAKTNSVGCVPLIGAFGTPSVTCTSPFDVSCVTSLTNKNGILFYGYGPQATPFYGGTMCVASPRRRTPVQTSAGVMPPPQNCTGWFTYDMNARIQSGIDPLLLVGVTVHAQYWSRDPASPFTVNLSDAIRFTIAP